MFKRITSITTLLLLFILTLGHAEFTTAQDLRIGYVDPQAVLSKMPEMRAVEQKLKNFAERKQNELTTKEQDFQQQVNEYQQKSAVISESAKAKEEERLGQLRADLQQYSQQVQQELQQKQQELIGPLLQEIETAINDVAAEMNLTYVLNTTTSTGDVIILYASPDAQDKYDITNQVMQKLDI